MGAHALKVADAGALVFRIRRVLLGVSEHFGEGHFHMLLHRGQVEVPRGHDSCL